MSLNAAASVKSIVEDLLVDLAWGQWAKMSSLVSKRSLDAQATIDPEALLLGSVIGSRKEKRLLDLAGGWLQQGARLISTQRSRTLASKLSGAHQDALATVAVLAGNAGDHRWKPHAARASEVSEFRNKDLGPVRLDVPEALMLRLRAGFGLGTKADVLAVLLGTGEAMTLRAISENLHYGIRPLRLALEDMVLAGLVERVVSTPAVFRVTGAQWSELLNGGYHGVPTRVGYPPQWQPWGDVLQLCSHLIAWSEEGETKEVTSYVAASRSRDILERFLTPALVRKFDLQGPSVSGRWDLQALRGFVSEFDAGVRAAA